MTTLKEKIIFITSFCCMFFIQATLAKESYLIDSDMHTGDVYATAIISNQRFISLGEDKKLVVRSTVDGNILKTLYLNHQLKGFHTFKLDTSGNLVYLLSRAVGEINHSRIDVLNLDSEAFIAQYNYEKATINDIQISKNNTQLFLSLAKRKLLRIVDLKSNHENDLLLRSAAVKICAPNNSHSIFIGLKNGDLINYNYLTKQKTKTNLGARIFDIDCSQPNNLIASLYNSNQVKIINKKTLELLSTQQVGIKSNENTYLNICQNSENVFFASGSAENKQVIQLYKISLSENKVVKQVSLGTNSTLALACTQNRVIAGTADPAIFLLNSSLKKVHIQGPITSDFRETASALQYREATGKITFSSRFGGRALKQFSFNDLSLKPVSGSGTSSSRYLPCSDALHALKNTQIKIASRCLSASLADTHLIVISDWEIFRFERKNGLYHALPTIKTAWRNYGVAFAEDNKNQFVIAASDGQLRWFKWQAKTHHFTLFSHRNGRSWAIWSNDLRYASSADIENSLKYFDASSQTYLSIDRVRERYAKNLSPVSIKKAQKSTLQQLAPTGRINVVRPVSGETLNTQNIEIEIHVTQFPDIQKNNIIILADGQPVSITRGLGNLYTAELIEIKDNKNKTEPNATLIAKKDSQFFTFRTTIPTGTKELVASYSHNQKKYRSSSIKLYWSQKPKDNNIFKSNRLLFLGFGMEDYNDKKMSLNFPNNDVQDTLQAFKDTGMQTKSNVFENARRADFENGFEWLTKNAKPKDLIVIFIAGHGVDYENQFYLLPTDTNLLKIPDTGISEHFLRSKLANLPSKTLVLLDACFSGKFKGSNLQTAYTDKTALNLRDGGSSISVFASSTGRQVSVENSDWSNGAFTEALVEALSGKADGFGRGKISLRDLEYYVSRRVSELTNHNQTPVMAIPPGVSDYHLVSL